MVVLRRTIGDVLRDERRGQQRTLREVSSTARVSLGYLSEVERGQKEASSELLASICGALEVPLSEVLGEVTRRIAVEEGVRRPFAAEGIIPTPASKGVPATKVPASKLPATALSPARLASAGRGASPVAGPVAAPAAVAEPVLVPVAPPVSAPAGETVDEAVESVVDSAMEELSAASASEFAVELQGLPAELELILRRRLVPAA